MYVSLDACTIILCAIGGFILRYQFLMPYQGQVQPPFHRNRQFVNGNQIGITLMLTRSINNIIISSSHNTHWFHILLMTWRVPNGLQEIYALCLVSSLAGNQQEVWAFSHFRWSPISVPLAQGSPAV